MFMKVTNVVNSLTLITLLYSLRFYIVKLTEGHRFPMTKYRIVRQGLQHEYMQHKHVSFHVSPLATQSELSTTHCIEYINRYITGQMTEKEVRKTGFPWSLAGVQRSLSSVGGTVAAMRSILEGHNSDLSDVSCHLAGGTHHAFYDYGEGYCIFSDIAVAANVALTEYPERVKRVLIIDLDVHQGQNYDLFYLPMQSF